MSTAQTGLLAAVPSQPLLGVPRSGLEAFFHRLGEPSFRASQLLQWVHHAGVTDFAQMSNFGLRLRSRLSGAAELLPARFSEEQRAADGCRKWLLPLAGGGAVETVFIPEQRRGTLCVSTQLGCALGCTFCATAQGGFKRNLSSAEIIAQVWRAHEALDAFSRGPPRRITNIVFMGMGEPLLNLEQLSAAVRLLRDDDAYGIPGRKLTLSTVGVVPMLDRLDASLQLALALSLHAPNDELRERLVPLNRRFPIAELLAACRRYLDRLGDSRRSITIEYTLIDGINDTPALAQDTARLLRGLRCKINLIPCNPIAGAPWRSSPPAAVAAFRQVLREAGYTVTVRSTRGEDIAAACGQLRGQVPGGIARRQELRA